MASPAAVLSILVKAQGVQTTAGQLKGLDAQARKAGTGLSATEKHAKRSSAAFASMGKAAGLAGIAVGAAGLAAGLKLANSEYREAQKVGAQTTAVLKSTGDAAKVTKKHVENLAGAISLKAGIDDEAIQTGSNLLLTFKGIRNETGKGNKIFDQATQVITDMSVAMKQGLKPSAIQVGKALNDPVKGMSALARVGVQFSEKQKKTITALVDSGDKLGAQKIILRELKNEFQGSAAAQATAGDKLNVAWHNLAEAAGGVLVPALDKVATFFTKVINQFVAGQGIAKFVVPVWNEIKRSGGDLLAVLVPFVQTVGPKLITFFQQLPGPVKIATAALAGLALIFAVGSPLMAGIAAFSFAAILIHRNWSTISPIINQVRDAITAWVTKNQADIAVVLKAFHDVGDVVKAVFQVVFPVVVGIAKRQLEGFKTALSGALQIAKGVIEVFLGVLHGDWSRVWGGLKDIAKGALRDTLGLLKVMTAPFREIGSRIVGGVIDGLSLLGHTILNKFKEAASFVISNVSNLFKGVGGAISKGVGKINPFGDGVGKVALPAGKGSAALIGANSSLGPFASVGSRFGLHVSSGRRPGAITTSGNVSYHSSGEAIDEAGSPAGMMGFFKFMKATYGSRLAELIYGPGKIGIKNGQPFNFGQKLNAQHMDHVHVALDTGKPGPGDGIGKARAAFTGDGTGNVKATWQFLIGKGLSPAQAAGVIGFMQGESGKGLSTTATNPGRDHAFGIAQWLGNRKAALMKRKNPSSLNTQLNFLWDELQGPEKASLGKLKGAHTIAAAVNAWTGFERPGKGELHLPMRLGNARSVFNALKGVSGKGASKTVAKVNPYDQKIASADVAIADAGHAIGKFTEGMRTAAALRVKQQIVGSRIRAVRAALKGKLTKPTRLRLTQELAQLIPEHKQLGIDRQTALAGPATTAAITDLGADPGTVDNTDAINALNDTITALNNKIDLQAQQHTELQRNLNTSQSQYGVLAKAIADVASGQIGGKAGLGFFTPSYAGGGSRY